MRPDELPIVVRRSRRITKDSSAVLTPETDYPLSNSRKKDFLFFIFYIIN